MTGDQEVTPAAPGQVRTDKRGVARLIVEGLTPAQRFVVLYPALDERTVLSAATIEQEYPLVVEP